MNTKTNLQLLTVLLLFSFSISLKSQCTVHTRDGGDFNSGLCTPGQPIGETFVACADGVITSVEVTHSQTLFLQTGSPGVYELYMAIDPGDGVAVTPTAVATEVLAVTPTAGQIMTFNLTTPFPVQNDGTLYRLVVANTTGNIVLAFQSGNDFAGGDVVQHTNVCDGTQDLDFGMIIQPNTVPTLSEWGLIILALLIMNMVMLYVVSPEVVLSSGQTVKQEISFRNLPFKRTSYFKILATVAIVALLVVTVSVLLFGYVLTTADPFGLLVREVYGA